jgi:hypothetical protein
MIERELDRCLLNIKACAKGSSKFHSTFPAGSLPLKNGIVASPGA